MHLKNLRVGSYHSNACVTTNSNSQSDMCLDLEACQSNQNVCIIAVITVGFLVSKETVVLRRRESETEI